MSVSLTKKTSADSIVKLVSVVDSAIDWEKSYEHVAPPKMEPAKDLSQEKLEEFENIKAAQHIELKKARFIETHEISSLQFLEGERPTVFHFKHPKRVDVQSKVRSFAAKNQMAMQAGNEMDLDALTEILHICYLGMSDGFDKEMEHVSREKGRITVDVLQAFEDNEILLELAVACYELNARKEAVIDPKKSKSLELGLSGIMPTSTP